MRRPAPDVRRARPARRAPRAGAGGARNRSGRRRRHLVDQPARVPGGVLRRAETGRRAGEPQLPVRRRGAGVRARRLRRPRGRLPCRYHRHDDRGGRRRRWPAAGVALGRRRRLRDAARNGTRRTGTPGSAALRRRPPVPLHRWHDRPPEGGRLAGRRLLPTGLGGGPPGHRAARPRGRHAGRQARRDPPARVAPRARHRARDGDRHPQRRRRRRAARRPAARCGGTVAAGGASNAWR